MKLKHKSVNAIQHILRCKALGVAFPLVSMFFIIYLMVSGVNIISAGRGAKYESATQPYKQMGNSDKSSVSDKSEVEE